MVTNIANISVSGLVAASRRLETATHNIANANSVGRLDLGPSPSTALRGQKAYQPRRLQQFSLENGGVATREVPVTPATVPRFSPGHPLANADGLVAAPNVSLAEQLVELKLAANSYRINATVLKITNQITGKLLDALS